jgi:hypothetical protein
MTALALANASAHAALRVAARMFSRVRSAFAWYARVNAEARIHRARLEAEMHRNRYRLRTKSDDDLPVII